MTGKLLRYSTFIRKNPDVRRRYERARQAAWDKRNLRTVSTHLLRREAATLRHICDREGVTPYALLARWLRAYIAADGDVEIMARPLSDSDEA